MKNKIKFYTTNEGYKVEVINHIDKKFRVIMFPDGNTKIVEQSSLSKGRVKNPNHKSVFNVGYIGYGTYKTSLDGNKTECYIIWVNMLLRCYSDKFLSKHPSYKGTTVAEEWHNFQNFAEWFHKHSNYKLGLELDKDLLVEGNKEYNNISCRFIPKELNNIIHSGKGVYYDKSNCKFIATCSLGNSRNKFLGRFSTEKEALKKYKEVKENYVKQRAEFYKMDIPIEIYKALINYKISG